MLAISAFLLAALPASAAASSATVSGGSLEYLAGSGEVNDVNVSLTNGTWFVLDGGATIAAGPGCNPFNSGEARCGQGGSSVAAIDAGDQGDAVTTSVPSDVAGGEGGDNLLGSDGDDAIDGGPGADAITGEGGADVLLGAGGDDAIRSQDGATDIVACGSGDDEVLADAQDVVRASCESVARGGIGGARSELRAAQLATKRLKVSSKRLAHLRIRCPRQELPRCTGTLTLKFSTGSGFVRVGRASFSIPSGRTRSVKVAVSSKGLSLLRRGRVKFRVNMVTRS